MRALQFLNAAILSTLVATSAALYAQDEKPPENKPPRQEEPRPEPKQDEMKAPRQDEAQPSKQEKQEQKEEKQEKQSREDMKQNRQEPAAQNDAHSRPAGKSGHIPDDRFRTNFGRSHTFVVQRTTVVEGRPGFVYGGYSFVFVDPWPVGWAYTDDCYVDYIDGDYFLFDMLHPGVRIALFVVM